MKAIWQGVIIAESDATITVEGNHYFPPRSIHKAFFVPSSSQTVCPWKGTASYYSLSVDGKDNPDAAWYYANPKPAASNIKDHIAFWHGVKITD